MRFLTAQAHINFSLMTAVGKGRSWITVLATPVAAAIAGGCAGSTQPASLALPAMTAPEPATASGSSTELYSRIARGAMACWFAPGGPLKQSYIYNADAKPEAEGGTAEITIHVRDESVQNPRGLKAFRVSIAPGSEGGTAKVTSENLKMPEEMSDYMKADVTRWSAGETGCGEATAGSTWAPKPPEPPAPATAVKQKKAKPAKKAARMAERPET